MNELLLVVVASALVNNLALTHLIGITPLVAVTRRLEVARYLGLAVIVVLPLTTTVTWLVDAFWLLPLELEHFSLLSFVFATALTLFVIQALFERMLPDYAALTRVLLPLLLASNIVLGTALLNQQYNDDGLWQTLAFGVGSGLGFALLLVLFAAQRERLQNVDIPAPFRGVAIDFISLGLTAMAFMGFSGLFKI